jgi:ferrous iron transport protein A
LAGNNNNKGVTVKVDPPFPLGRADRGFRGRIHMIQVGAGMSDLPEEELENRLIELGFVEGAAVEVLHEGPFGGDPIAVRVQSATIALRRREAMAILVTRSDPPA